MEYAIRNNGVYESITFNSSVIQTQGKGTITLQAKIDDNLFTDYLVITKENQITTIKLPEEVNLKLVSNYPFSYSIPNYEPKYYNKTKIEDYLYEITYGNIDYEYAYKYFKPNFGGCSSIRKGLLFGRNFDWLYNNDVQFVVHTPNSLDHYAVLGVSGIIPGIEQSNVDNDTIIIDGVDMFKLVPFYLLDGINLKGVFCTHNVVDLDDEDSPTTIIYAKKEEKDRVCIPMLPRFILDKFATAKQALDYLINYTTLYFTEEMILAHYQSHFLLGDKDTTYIIEFIDGEIKVINKPYITNFNIYNVTFGEDNLINFPPTQQGVSKYGAGIERWNIIASNYMNDDMYTLLDKIKYTTCYKNPFWYSEIVRMEDNEGNPITVDTLPSLCTRAKLQMQNYYRHKDRNNPKIWITCHSCVYDIIKEEVNIRNLEGTVIYKFSLL